MKMIKTAFIAFFTIFTLNTALSALDLNSVKASDIQTLTADMNIPAAKAMSDALFQDNGIDPVVITVPGLKFAEIGPEQLELKSLLKLLRMFFPKKDISQYVLSREFEKFNREYFMLEDDETLPVSRNRLPDNYIEEKLKELPGYANHSLVILPFRWSRDPDDSEAVIPELAARIAEVYDQYMDSGRPVYVLAHSWGSVLSHSALHQLGRTRPDVKVARFITMGSPLMPANFVVDLFVKVGIKKEHLEKVVSKPAIVAQWRNIWASRDMMSNAIKAADSNNQVDSSVENVEPELIDLILHNKLLKKDARIDLFKIRNITDWHGSYFYDYHAILKSLNKEIFIPIFKPVLAPQLVDCQKPPLRS